MCVCVCVCVCVCFIPQISIVIYLGTIDLRVSLAFPLYLHMTAGGGVYLCVCVQHTCVC